jgi:hypothetical protein
MNRFLEELIIFD